MLVQLANAYSRPFWVFWGFKYGGGKYFKSKQPIAISVSRSICWCNFYANRFSGLGGVDRHTNIHTCTHTEFGQCGSQYTGDAGCDKIGSAIAEGPRDAPCQLILCQLLHRFEKTHLKRHSINEGHVGHSRSILAIGSAIRYFLLLVQSNNSSITNRFRDINKYTIRDHLLTITLACPSFFEKTGKLYKQHALFGLHVKMSQIIHTTFPEVWESERFHNSITP